MDPGSLAIVDRVALALVALAVLRGLWIGLLREAFSLAALAGAVLVVRVGTAPFGAWIEAQAPLDLSPLAASIAAGTLLALTTLLAVALIGRMVRRGAHWAGLGLADRIGGGVLGAAEGALVVAVLLLVGGAALGRTHPALADSRALEVLESAERLARATSLAPPDVASPPPRSP